MPRLSDFAFAKIPPKEIGPAILLGLAGLCLNTLELNLGWGLQFLFGNALIFAFIRVLAPPSTILAVSVSSIWSIVLWNHPWTWIVWVCEAAFIAYYARRTSPTFSDVIFWLLLGTPLLFIFYGIVLDVDQASLFLVVLKQVANGILNVVLGEIIYAIILTANPFGKFGHWPKMKVESFLLMLLVGTTLVPATVYLALDAPSRERATLNEISGNVESRMSISEAKLSAWVDSRSMLLGNYADISQLRSKTDEGLPKAFSAEFENITILAPGRTLETFALAEGSSLAGATAAIAGPQRQGEMRSRLVAFTPQQTRLEPHFALIVPYNRNGTATYIVAQLRPTTLHDLVEIPGRDFTANLFVSSAVQGTFALTAVTPNVRTLAQAMSPSQRTSALTTPVILGDFKFGRALMSDMRDSYIVRAGSVAALPDWQVEAVLPFEPAILKARAEQLLQFSALNAAVFVMTLIALFMSKKVSRTLGRVSQSAEDLARFGGLQATGDWIVIDEVSEISGTIAATNETFGHERGALASYQRRLNGIAEHAPVVLYAFKVVNGEGSDVTYRSPSVQKILGYTTDESSTATWWRDAVHPDDYESCAARFSNVEPGKVYAVEYRIRHKNGQYIWVYDTLSVEYNSEAGELEAVGLMTDVSERKAAADQLLQADKMASLGRLISGTAHELNQPLNFIKMAASNLRENAVRGRLEAEKFIPKLESVLTQVERASAILLQMRIFGRTSKEPPSAINIQDTVQAVILMAEPQMEFDGTQVVMQVKASDIYVRAFPVMLEQVLLNLVINANDAIRGQNTESGNVEGEIKITIDRNEGSAIITVADNGPGIAADVLPKIFEPFFTTKPLKEGTGLGLSISYGIIRDMGGVLRAKSSRKGARFIIELPLADAAAAKAA